MIYTYCISLQISSALIGLRTWEDNDHIHDIFFSGLEVEAEVGPEPLGHDGELETFPTLPYFLAIPYPHPVIGHVLIGHPIARPLPDGDYNLAIW